jgi:hypothetical protein
MCDIIATASRVLRKIQDINIRFAYKYFSRGPVFFFFFIGLYYALRVFDDFAKDTTTITNVAFGITVAFSSLSFRWSSTIEDSEEDKKQIAYCGERFLHASLLLILASVIKYAVIAIGPATINKIPQFSQIPWRQCITVVFGNSVSFLFLYALFFTHTGVKILNQILWKRVSKYSDWDSLI